MIPLAATSLRRKAAIGALIALLAWGSTLGLDLAGILKPYSLKTLDLLFRITPLSPASPEVVVITVDQPDLDFFQKQGVSWPWPRQLYAPIIEFCRRGGARAMIFDVLYTETSVYGAEDDQRLAQTVAASGALLSSSTSGSIGWTFTRPTPRKRRRDRPLRNTPGPHHIRRPASAPAARRGARDASIPVA